MTRWQDAHGPTWNGLAPGQSWAIPADGPWQARLDRAGRAHCIGRALAEHPLYGWRYADPSRGHLRFVPGFGDFGKWRPRPWYTFARACAVANRHERMTIAAKRQAAQAGQGGE